MSGRMEVPPSPLRRMVVLPSPVPPIRTGWGYPPLHQGWMAVPPPPIGTGWEVLPPTPIGTGWGTPSPEMDGTWTGYAGFPQDFLVITAALSGGLFFTKRKFGDTSHNMYKSAPHFRNKKIPKDIFQCRK